MVDAAVRSSFLTPCAAVAIVSLSVYVVGEVPGGAEDCTSYGTWAAFSAATPFKTSFFFDSCR